MAKLNVFRRIKLLFVFHHLMFRQQWKHNKLGLVQILGKLFTSVLVMFCSTRSRFHLCMQNRPWKENYNQPQGRKEGTAHIPQPNILIYKELIKYFKSKVASQFSHWWLVWEMSVSLLSVCSISPLAFSSHRVHVASLVQLSLCLHCFPISSQLLCLLRFFFFLPSPLFIFALLSSSLSQ